LLRPVRSPRHSEADRVLSPGICRVRLNNMLTNSPDFGMFSQIFSIGSRRAMPTLRLLVSFVVVCCFALISSPLFARQPLERGPTKGYTKPEMKSFNSLAKALASAEKEATSKHRIKSKHKKSRTKFAHKSCRTKKFAHHKHWRSKKAYSRHWKSKKKHGIKSKTRKKTAFKKSHPKRKTGRSSRARGRS
jgi:hypothetical protein